MTETGETPPPPGEGIPSVAARLALYQRAGGIVTPLITTVFAFLLGGLVVQFVAGKNPFTTYWKIFKGTGLTWLWPWLSHPDRLTAAYNLQNTLLLTIPLVLTALAVAFAFRCGLFNIGGQGQYGAGAIVAVWVGSSFAGLAGAPHIVLAIVLAGLAGALLAGIAGLLRATVGAHEVITTIMLNWIVFWSVGYLFGLHGPLQSGDPSATESKTVVDSAHLPYFWGDPILGGVHIGLFVALAALVAYWVVLNRTTVGYEVRAVGFNAEAARYAGIGVARNYFVAMAISGFFAGLGGAIHVMGAYPFKVTVESLQESSIGFLGIAVALLGRNSAVGILFSALLFGALVNGTSSRNVGLFRPDVTENLTLIIQGLVVLFVGADVLVLYLWRARRKLRLTRKEGTAG